MRLSGVGQREMRHLVHQHPVGEQLLRGHPTPELHADEGVGIGEGLAAVHAGPGLRHEPHPDGGGGEAPVIAGDDVGRAPRPLEDRRCLAVEVLAVELKLQHRTTHAQLLVRTRGPVSGQQERRQRHGGGERGGSRRGTHRSLSALSVQRARA